MFAEVLLGHPGCGAWNGVRVVISCDRTMGVFFPPGTDTYLMFISIDRQEYVLDAGGVFINELFLNYVPEWLFVRLTVIVYFDSVF